MTLYHGTHMIIDQIDLGKSRNRTDFGKGFYLTDKIGTAQNWAVRKVELEGEGTPTILSYEISSDLYSLSGLRFPNTPDTEWLEFICSNRSVNPQNLSMKEPRHDFSWLSGSIANDKVVDVVAEYMRNEIDINTAIQRLRVLPQTYQLSVHTTAAIGFVNDVDVFYKQLKNGRWTQNWKKR